LKQVNIVVMDTVMVTDTMEAENMAMEAEEETTLNINQSLCQ
jgi:hypothetical protein